MVAFFGRGLALLLFALALPLAAQGGAQINASVPTVLEEKPPIIPIAHFAKQSILSGPVLAPDGRYIAARITGEGNTAVTVIDVDSRKSVAQVVLGDGMQYEWHRWAGSGRVLVSLSTLLPLFGEETRVTRLLVLDVATGKQSFVGPRGMGIDGDEVLYIAPDGSSVLLTFQKSVYDWPSVHKFSLLVESNKGEQVQPPVNGIWSWIADDQGAIRVGMGMTRSGLRIIYRKNASDKFREIARVREDDEDSGYDVMRIISGSDEGYALKKLANGRVGLVRFNYATRQAVETVYGNADWDVEDAWLDDNGKPLAADFTNDRDRRVWFDPAMAKLQKGLEKALNVDEVWIGSRSEDGTRMLVHAGGETDPGVLYLYEAGKRALDVLTVFRPELDPQHLARPKPITYAARDGTPIHGYLTLPRGRRAVGLPLVILPHGGPYGIRDKLIYDDEVQLLANRGYAVLQPNYRGSSGYGLAFFELGHGQIGRAMQDDLDDGMDWVVKQGIADPARVCVVGASYGGYAAMWAAIRNPERYRCAASFAGVSDWKKQLRYDRNFFSRKGSRKWRDRVRGEGDFDLDLVAPAQAMKRLTRPLLVAHGKKDSNVPFNQHKLVQTAATAAGVKIEDLVFEDEGHGFTKPENEARWFEALTAFLAQHNPAD